MACPGPLSREPVAMDDFEVGLEEMQRVQRGEGYMRKPRGTAKSSSSPKLQGKKQQQSGSSSPKTVQQGHRNLKKQFVQKKGRVCRRRHARRRGLVGESWAGLIPSWQGRSAL